LKYGATIAGESMRVLLIEDDPMIGEAIQEELKDASYATDWVKNGQTALTTVSCQNYDLISLDLGLPGKDSLDVLKSIHGKDNRGAVAHHHRSRWLSYCGFKVNSGEYKLMGGAN
jgi:CheY-like chemotaxis protein